VLEKFRTLCRERGWMNLRECSDPGDETDGWAESLDLAKKRVVDVIVVPDFGSFPFSDEIGFFLTEQELRERGASIYVMSEGVSTATETGRFVFTCLVATRLYRKRCGPDR
jgi:hypothetical protein